MTFLEGWSGQIVQYVIIHRKLLFWKTSLANLHIPTTLTILHIQIKHHIFRPIWLLWTNYLNIGTISCACTHTHTCITHTMAELLAAFGTRQSRSVGRGLCGLHCWPHLPALVEASFLCWVPSSGVSTATWVLAKSFSLCGQMRGSSQIASLMTFLLSLELLSLPKDNFPMMTKVSDSINFHLSEKCGSN